MQVDKSLIIITSSVITPVKIEIVFEAITINVEVMITIF
jgi:hypothetical protein